MDLTQRALQTNEKLISNLFFELIGECQKIFK